MKLGFRLSSLFCLRMSNWFSYPLWKSYPSSTEWCLCLCQKLGFCMGVVAQMVKNLLAMQETLVRKIPGGGHGSALQYSCLENPMDRGAWRASPWDRKGSDTTAQLALCLSPGKCPERWFYNILPYPVHTQIFPIISKMFLFFNSWLVWIRTKIRYTRCPRFSHILSVPQSLPALARGWGCWAGPFLLFWSWGS